MRFHSTIFLLLVGLLVGVACARDDRPMGPSFDIRVAPLDLLGITNTHYRVTVTNGPDRAGEIVWQEDLWADDFGDGMGSLSYVGPCDADDPSTPNSVTIELHDLMTGDPTQVPLDDDEYVNPCGEVRGWTSQVDRGDLTLEDAEDRNGPCTINRICRENADEPIEFNLTLMRDANQGFFDVAVNFEDIFCAAKLDCVDALLHRPGGARDLTAVLGFACTSGADTCLYVDAVTLTCDNGTWMIDPTLGPGSIPENSPVLYGAAVYSGDEAFTGFQKRYWNVALGLDETAFAAAQNCTLTWSGSASEEALTANTTPANATYPRVVWSRDIIVDGELACGAHALNEVIPGEITASVATSYTAPDQPYEFDFSSCEEVAPPDGARWMIGDIELVAYDRESGIFSLRDATRLSPGNTIASSSWAVEETPYSGLSDGVAGTAPLAGAGDTFTFTSRVGWEGYVGCRRALGIPDGLDPAPLTDLSTSGMFLNQTYHPFTEPIFVRRDGVATGDQQLLLDEIDSVLTQAGFPHSGLTPINPFSMDLVGSQLALVNGLSAPIGQTLFPSTLLWFDRIDPPTMGYPGDDQAQTQWSPPFDCATEGTTVGSEQVFRVTLTTTDAHGETVQTRALVWNYHNEKGGVFVGGDIARTGTTLTLTGYPRGVLDHVPPGTTFNRIWLDHDGDGAPDAEDPSGVFTHDFAVAGLHRGTLSADDDPYWGMGFGEIFSEFYFFAP